MLLVYAWPLPRHQAQPGSGSGCSDRDKCRNVSRKWISRNNGSGDGRRKGLGRLAVVSRGWATTIGASTAGLVGQTRLCLGSQVVVCRVVCCCWWSWRYKVLCLGCGEDQLANEGQGEDQGPCHHGLPNAGEARPTPSTPSMPSRATTRQTSPQRLPALVRFPPKHQWGPWRVPVQFHRRMRRIQGVEPGQDTTPPQEARPRVAGIAPPAVSAPFHTLQPSEQAD